MCTPSFSRFAIWTLLIAAALLAGTASPSHAQADTEQGALSPDTIQQIERLLSETISAGHIPGLSIALVLDGRLAWANGYGLADVEQFVPATATTVYRTASIGKPMTATAVMRLAETGRLDLDAPIQRYCPAFPEKRWPVTTRHLLSHTSGIRHYGGPRHEAELYSATPYDSVTDALEVFKEDSLLFQPGTAYQYSTYGYNVLGCIVEGASGMDFMAFMHAHVFEPAGMTRTQADNPYALIPGRAPGYQLVDDGTLRRSRWVDMSNKLPAGGYVTTVEDLARFATAFMSGTLVHDATRAAMLTPQRTTDGEVIPIGLGWGLFPGETWYGEREAFHGGVTPKVSGMLYLLPDRWFAVALLMNLEAVPDRTDLAATIARIVLDLSEEIE